MNVKLLTVNLILQLLINILTLSGLIKFQIIENPLNIDITGFQNLLVSLIVILVITLLVHFSFKYLHNNKFSKYDMYQRIFKG